MGRSGLDWGWGAILHLCTLPRRFRQQGKEALDSRQGRGGGQGRGAQIGGPCQAQGSGYPGLAGSPPPPQSSTNTRGPPTARPATAGKVLQTVTSVPSCHLFSTPPSLASPGIHVGFTCSKHSPGGPLSWAHASLVTPGRPPTLSGAALPGGRAPHSEGRERTQAPMTMASRHGPSTGPAEGLCPCIPHPTLTTAPGGRTVTSPIPRPELRGTERGRELPQATQPPAWGGWAETPGRVQNPRPPSPQGPSASSTSPIFCHFPLLPRK